MKRLFFRVFKGLKSRAKVLVCFFLKYIYIYGFDKEWFRNKRVAIIGGADSVLVDKLGYYIDCFDVVVRINKGVELIENQSEYVGTRTDFLFHSLYDEGIGDAGSSPITLDLWEKHKVKHVVFSNNCTYSYYGAYNFFKFLRKVMFKKRITQLPLFLLKKNLSVIESPTTGFSTINTIFNCNPKEIYLTGITFMKTPHNTLYREDMTKEYISKSSHNMEVEYQYVKNLYLENRGIIKTDETLRSIFENN